MKHFDDNTKKLIKNVVSLITSALVLVAATVAWFHFAGERVSVNGMQGGLNRTNFSVAYYRLGTVEGKLTSVTTGTGSAAAFNITTDSTSPSIPDSFMPMTEGKWETSSGAGGWSIDHLYPGEYDVFRMDIDDIDPRLIIQGITCTDANNRALSSEQLTTVYQNVYLYAVAVQTDTSTTSNTYPVMTTPLSEDIIVCDSLYNLFNGVGGTGFDITASQSITTLTGVDPALTENNSASTILIFIGIPGSSVTSGTGSGAVTSNLKTEHEALRQIGAKLSINSYSVSVN